MKPPLTLKEQAFITAYTDINSNTYGNGTKSIYKAGYTVKNDKCAGVYAVRLLNKDRIKRYMEEKLEAWELDVNNHIRSMSETISELMDKARGGKKLTVGELDKLSRPIRLLCEYSGKIGSGHNTAIQINLGNGRDVSTLGLFDLDQFERAIQARRKELLSGPAGSAIERLIEKRLNTPQVPYICPKEEDSLGYIPPKSKSE